MDIISSYRLAKRNVLVNTDPGTLIFLIMMPTIYLVFMGYMYGSLISGLSIGGHSVQYISFLSPGIIAFQTLTAGAVAGSMLWSDRRYGMFEQILSGPYTRAEYLLGIIFTTMALSTFGAIVMLLLSFVLRATVSISPISLAAIVVSLIFGSLFWGSFMLALAAKSKSNQMYNSIQILILFFASFASTVFYPVSANTPAILRYTMVVNPLTYVTDAIRDGYVANFGLSFFTDEAVLIAETAFMFLIALMFYRKVRVGVK
ncbi:MAG: ABC transporter permease [Thermoplasmata archaeon]|uniref:ABC transporter permease n=1 Tax=Candidatus Sysuiplasma superficiale TaxID=2823368 RepID=A0A8J7YWP3_9ARCH|nr:ABC transporter permease [Candidatus Sysuiplasma superficiale]MBX8644224.1 ABC transporter permease [Candidatus Sysuiplasma superficiale]MCL4347029.1 ABC transporter permease [Candidatus Thermoplasmatota archaeon]MCL5437524.1 ABC transporter permease [Candidatus Thermoplasmatota archaeon]